MPKGGAQGRCPWEVPKGGAQGIAPTLSSVHVFGEVNIMADASSQARFALINSVARQLSVPHRRVEPSARALAFLDAARNDARTRAPSAKRARTAEMASPGAQRSPSLAWGSPTRTTQQNKNQLSFNPPRLLHFRPSCNASS